MRFMDVERMKESTLKRFMRLPRFEEHLEVHRMDCLASHGDLELYQFVSDKLRTTPAAEIRPSPLLNGRDLIAMGYQPGPRFKEILAAVEDAQLEGKLRSREEAVRWVEHEFQR
jgi:poly(A) polymerase